MLAEYREARMAPDNAGVAPLLSAPAGPTTVGPPDETAGARVHLSLVLPTYNESKNIREMVSRLTRILDGAFAGGYEIIVVDDDSPDRTWELAQSLTAEYPQLRVMRRQQERGLSTAVIRGWQASRGEVLGVIDADMQHPPEIIPKLWTQIELGADLAVASRRVQGGSVSKWSLRRRLISRLAEN